MARRRRLPTFFRPSEAAALLEAATKTRDRLILTVGLYCGLRVSEITGLEITDVDLERGALMVRHGKGDKDRQIPLNHDVRAQLAAWIGTRRTGYLFPSPRKAKRLSARAVQLMIKRVARKAGIAGVDVPRKITPHKCRHSFATALLESGSTIREVQELMGHADLSSAEIYLHVQADRLQNCVSRLSFGKSAIPTEPADKSAIVGELPPSAPSEGQREAA